MSPSVPRPSRRPMAALVLLAFVGLPPLAGCGKKGDPEPPILRVPAPTRDLAVVQRGDRLLVDLGYPTTTAAGTQLGGVDRVTLSALDVPIPSATQPAVEIDERQFAAGAEPILVLEGDDLEAAVRGDRIAFDLPVPPADDPGTPSALALGITTRGPDGQVSAPSNRISFPRVEPPAPPTDVEATGQAGGVRVRWSHPLIEVVRERLRADAATGETADEAGKPGETEPAPEDEADEAEEGEEDEAGASDGEGIPFAGFNVYRRRATERTYGPPIRTIGPRADNLVDDTARLGERYIYAVTSVATRRPVTVESGFAEEVEVHYLDRFAPPRPTGLVALTEGAQVRLVWQASEAADLAGYRVYRRGPDTQEFRPVTDQPVTTAGYTDRGLSTGATYTYQVTAVDAEGNESPPSAPVTAAIR